MKKIASFLLLVFITTTLFFKAASIVHAQNYLGGCTAVSQCINNKRCIEDGNGIVYPNGPECGSAQLGGVKPPASINRFNLWSSVQGNDPKAIGLLSFVSLLLRLFAIVCGIWTMFNFLMSGYTLISSQYDTKAQTEVKDKLTMTVIGLVIIVGAYTMAGLFGLIFFGDASAIINPKLQGALQ